jgi:alcohol dehydrogenase
VTVAVARARPLRDDGALAPGWESELGGTRLVAGAGALERLGELVRAAGFRRPLVVTDAGVRDAGHLDHALSVLEEAGLDAAPFDDVRPNPTTADVERAAEAAAGWRADGFVGLGGGSAMDCAKGANFLVTNGGRMEDYQGRGKARKPLLPSIGVPTTAGTGSDAQSFALIAREGTHEKMACGDPGARFRAVVLDPRLAATVPAEVAAASGADAISHVVESYVTLPANPISKMLGREAWRLLDQAFPAVIDGPTLADWERMLLGAHLAGAAIERSMLGAAHACANPLTARFGIVHGRAVGLMLPAVMAFNSVSVGRDYDELARASRPGAPDGWLPGRVRELLGAAGVPASLAACEVPRAVLPGLAADASRQWTARFNPRAVSERELLELYEAAHR